MDTKFKNLRTVGTLIVGSTLTVVGAITGASFVAPSGSNTVVNSPASQAVVLQLEGTEFKRYSPPTAMTATGGGISNVARYDTFLLSSPLTTTGALRGVHIDCGNVSKALEGSLSFVKAAKSATGTSLPNFNKVTLGTGSYVYYLSGATLFNPADKLKFGTLTAPTGTLNTTRYNCKAFLEVDDIYGR